MSVTRLHSDMNHELRRANTVIASMTYRIRFADEFQQDRRGKRMAKALVASERD